MSTFNDLTGGEVPLVLGDKTYFLTPKTDAFQAKTERHLQEQAYKALQAQKEALGEDYRQVFGDLTDRIGSGLYSYGSRAWADYMRTPLGVTHTIWLLLQPKHPELTVQDVLGLVVQYSQEIAEVMKNHVLPSKKA